MWSKLLNPVMTFGSSHLGRWGKGKSRSNEDVQIKVRRHVDAANVSEGINHTFFSCKDDGWRSVLSCKIFKKYFHLGILPIWTTLQG